MRLIVSAISARGTVTTASCTSCSSRRKAPSAEPAWMVPIPPGCPVPHALRRSRASAPRTSPIGMRSGRSRRDERTRSESFALKLARVLDQYDAVGGLCHLSEERIDQRRLARGRAAGNEDIASLRNNVTKNFSLIDRDDSCSHVVLEGEDRDRRLADGECRRCDDRRDQAFETLPGIGHFRRNARRCSMNFRTDVMGDETHDPLAIGGRKTFSSFDQPFGEPIEP